ncbi:MAG: hypothetical protein WC205_16915 [Opitutaceae bacterium]|jgi:hypothetical protein
MSDKTKLSVLSGRPTIREYAQGAAQEATSELATFIAPPVEVSKHTGKYKVYDEETRFKIPETMRGLGGEATIIRFDQDDENYDCSPHAIDSPLDNIEIEEEEGEALLMETADEVAALAGLSHEKRVIDTAVANAPVIAEKGDWTDDAKDPVAELNDTIINIMKAAGYGSMMQVGIVLPPSALVVFFANAKVKGYFPGIEAIAPTLENFKKLLISADKTFTKVSWLSYDAAPKGKAKDKKFFLEDKLLAFARLDKPTRRDPSFMKTFRVRGRWMMPGTYPRTDGRGEVVKMDWSEQVLLTNAAASEQYNIT